MKIKLLVLANSRKTGGRCLAGIRTDTLEWVRPVTAGNHNEMPTHTCLDSVTNRQIQPLDLIEIEITESVPLKYQRENWLYGQTPLRVLQHYKIEVVYPKLISKVEKQPWFLKDGKTRISPLDFRTYKTNAPSLSLLEVASAEIFHNQRGSRRISFKGGGNTWDLPFTDDLYAGPDGKVGRCLLTLSIGEEWHRDSDPADHGWHYKLVAALILLPEELAPDSSKPATDSLLAICERLFGFVPKVSENRNQIGRFSTTGWFYQDLVQVNCELCGNPDLLVFRKHFKKYAKEMHYWGIVCGSCKTASDSKVFNKKFVAKINESIEAKTEVAIVCTECISNSKNF